MAFRTLVSRVLAFCNEMWCHLSRHLQDIQDTVCSVPSDCYSRHNLTRWLPACTVYLDRLLLLYVILYSFTYLLALLTFSLKYNWEKIRKREVNVLVARFKSSLFNIRQIKCGMTFRTAAHIFTSSERMQLWDHLFRFTFKPWTDLNSLTIAYSWNWVNMTPHDIKAEYTVGKYVA